MLFHVKNVNENVSTSETEDIVSDVMHNEAHFYCSSSERTECGKPEEPHSQSPVGQKICAL